MENTLTKTEKITFVIFVLLIVIVAYFTWQGYKKRQAEPKESSFRRGSEESGHGGGGGHGGGHGGGGHHGGGWGGRGYGWGGGWGYPYIYGYPYAAENCPFDYVYAPQLGKCVRAID